MEEMEGTKGFRAHIEKVAGHQHRLWFSVESEDGAKRGMVAVPGEPRLCIVFSKEDPLTPMTVFVAEPDMTVTVGEGLHLLVIGTFLPLAGRRRYGLQERSE